jgi:nucleoside-diphosphate-sugar epimerase
MRHLLILGGSGFFGKSILDAYKNGYLRCHDIEKITIVSRSATSLAVDVPFLIDESINLVSADISNCNSLPVADLVIHAAASTDASRYLHHPEKETLNALAGMSNFCNLARSYLRNSKILFTSSGAVYGNYSPNIEFIDEGYSVNEANSVDGSKFVYTAAKRDCERLIKELGADGLDVSIARCFAFVGRYLPRDQHFAIGNFINDGLNERPIQVNTKSIIYRSFMHGDDLANWLIKICLASNQSAPIFNVGSDEAISIQDLAQKIANYFGVSANMIPPSSEISRYIPSINKAKKELNLALEKNLDEAIDSTIKSIRGI